MKGLVLTWLLFIVADFLYLGVLRKTDMKAYFQNINQNPEFPPRFLAAAIATWLLLALGVELLVVPRARTSLHAAGWGALFGFLVYGIYDLTNLATIQKWTLSFSIQDIAWGTLLTAVISTIRFLLLKS